MRTYDWPVHLYFGRIYHGNTKALSAYVRSAPIIACFSSEWEADYFVNRLMTKGFIDSTGKVV